MKAVILFHSVTGNCYEMAQAISKQFNKSGISSDICRIPDLDQQKWSNEIDTAKKFYNYIVNIPEVSVKKMPEYDLMVLCSPTYFGNVSAEVKGFMDDMACYWLNRKMSGKVMVACASAASHVGGGDLALQAIITFAQHMGMLPYSINSMTMPAYGLLHIAGPTSELRVKDNKEFAEAVEKLAKELATK